VLTPFDDYPIHPSADPIAHPATGDPNHYDRYWFNGQDKGGAFFLAGAMGHYPVRGVVDAAFSVVYEGVEHSLFASGRMPFDRKTEVGPIRIDVVEPMRSSDSPPIGTRGASVPTWCSAPGPSRSRSRASAS